MLAARSVFSGILFLFMTALILPVEAATRFVDGAVGADAGDCTLDPCATIGYAVDQAAGGDTIDIADSIYTEMLTIDKSLIFQGETESGTIIQAHTQPLMATGRVLTSTGELNLTLADLTVRHGNQANGAGLQMGGRGDLVLTRVTFHKNSAGNGQGGALKLASVGCNITMTDVRFLENDADQGGGFDLLDCDLVAMDKVEFSANDGRSCGGGGKMTRIAQSRLTNAGFFDNTAGTSGGAGLCVLNSSVEASAIEFRGNFSGTAGGAIYSSNSTWTITNGLFSGNRASINGSAIHNVTSASITNLINVAIVGNRSDGGEGAINFVGADMKIHNTVFWNNQNVDGVGTPQASIWSLNGSADVQNSLVQGFSAAQLGGTGNLDGSTNPLFTATPSPAAAPTTSGDLHLRESSPARDAGNNVLIAGFDFDLDGLDRIFGGTVDLGPYEWGSDILFRDRFE